MSDAPLFIDDDDMTRGKIDLPAPMRTGEKIGDALSAASVMAELREHSLLIEKQAKLLNNMADAVRRLEAELHQERQGRRCAEKALEDMSVGLIKNPECCYNCEASHVCAGVTGTGRFRCIEVHKQAARAELEAADGGESA